jgi:dethiobiotin synthetase
MKPIAAGAEMVAGEFINEDAARLRAAGSFDPGLALLNPYCLASPIAPHIAAAEEGVAIEPGPSSPPSNAQAQADWCWWKAWAAFACRWATTTTPPTWPATWPCR